MTMESRVNDLEKALFKGNGKPALLERVGTLENIVSRIEKAVIQQAKDKKTQTYFVIAQTIMIVIAVATIILK